VNAAQLNRRRWLPESDRAHVESHFLRFNDPAGERAIWLKGTVIDGPSRSPAAELWCCVFDGDKRWGERVAAPAQTALHDGGLAIGESSLRLAGGQGEASGSLSNARGQCRWALTWRPRPGPLGSPMHLFPYRWMLQGGFPKSKLVSPVPLLDVSGYFEWDGVRVELDGWIGMQGHNWGAEHAPEYAWGQAWFGDPEPDCIVEGFTARTRIGPILSPRLSCLAVRFEEREFRFDRFWRLSGQRGIIGQKGSWNLEMMSRQGRARLWMQAPPERSVCLGYENPDGARRYCFNSKTARARLWLQPKGEAPIERSSATGALEFLSSEPNEAYGPVI
jgi:hypothetical protein